MDYRIYLTGLDLYREMSLVEFFTHDITYYMSINDKIIYWSNSDEFLPVPVKDQENIRNLLIDAVDRYENNRKFVIETALETLK